MNKSKKKELLVKINGLLDEALNRDEIFKLNSWMNKTTSSEDMSVTIRTLLGGVYMSGSVADLDFTFIVLYNRQVQLYKERNVEDFSSFDIESRVGWVKQIDYIYEWFKEELTGVDDSYFGDDYDH